MDFIKRALADITVVTVLGMGTGALIASELGNRAMIAAGDKPAINNQVFAAFLGVGALFTVTAQGFAQAVGMGMAAWGGGKLLFRNVIVPVARKV